MNFQAQVSVRNRVWQEIRIINVANSFEDTPTRFKIQLDGDIRGEFNLCKGVNLQSSELPVRVSHLCGAEMFQNNFHGVLDSQKGERWIKRGWKEGEMHVRVCVLVWRNSNSGSRKGLKFSEGLRKQSTRECGMVCATWNMDSALVGEEGPSYP